ncbi:C2 domain and Peroxin/Ferlin domain and Peroxin/Dysferlin domain and Ferlin B-domain and FerIin domain-containing protein [Strongyloides ratti]|uniref:C2 domain and Peroxin/Ferlin domain and Peroxin/Dysferlin domain and Ferlin B-domain and FerIin domain-containing protein n=1 Tax=Strongyloides ratti TaxID=34506 RepID=A0A090LMZ4_STRRB|nr:C2 domain and Peroxin/Ferlin domain and Peroxin/Dysferlin domain and Ferlin B-domain and FerIin domain-containing protein [Strongyloides ratti]CEF68905.1 C2 domain and Peroxin/Ferlin domain and Peroxin/Dysferlin domain and Ferlin B-domain and FerIin domain-containing protein [Strongyloides ratti]
MKSVISNVKNKIKKGAVNKVLKNNVIDSKNTDQILDVIDKTKKNSSGSETEDNTDSSLDVTTSEKDYSVASTCNPNDSIGDSEHSTGDSSTNSLTGSEWDTSTISSSDSDYGNKERNKLKNKKRKNLATETINQDNQYDVFAENPTIQHNFFVLVRVIEAKDLANEDIDPVVKVILDGKNRKTNIFRRTNSPVFNQTFTFKLKVNLEQLTSKNIDFSLYCAKKFFKDSAIGSFKLNLGLVYRQKDHVLRQKWLSLSSPKLDEDDGEASDVCGFLKVSVSVYHENQTPPSLTGKDKGNENEVLQSGQNLNHHIRVRLFKLCQLADFIRYPGKNSKQPGELGIEVKIGKKIIQSEYVVAENNSIDFNEELLIPISWPSVVNEIRFRVIMKRKKWRKRVLLTASILMNDICKCGLKGFLPTFGPSYISFYGPDKINSTLSIFDIKDISQGKIEGTLFCGRLFLEIQTFEEYLKSSTSTFLPNLVVSNTKVYQNYVSYVLFVSFYAVNQMHPDFKDKLIHFTVSIGEYGNDAYNSIPNNSNTTLPVQPMYDGIQYYSMPWGNYKPICELPCIFEDVGYRIIESNLLSTIHQYILTFRSKLQMIIRSNPDNSLLADKTLECIHEVTEALNFLNDWNRNTVIKNIGLKMTTLDLNQQESRFANLQALVKEFDFFKNDKSDIDDLGELCINLLSCCADKFKKLMRDVQISIPDVVITMYCNYKSIGFIKLPICDMFFSSSKETTGNGNSIGKIKPYLMKRINQKKTKYKEDDIPCVIHLKTFFGYEKVRNNFEKILQPGELRYYVEYFENQQRKIFSDEWSQTKKNPFGTTDVTGKIPIYEDSILPPSGWNFKGKWEVKRCHDIWIGADVGHNKFEDEMFENQKKVEKEWEFYGFTDFYGNDIDPECINKPPKGWKYEENWKVDKFCPGDMHGWCYSMAPDLWSRPNECDINEKFTHLYKRRRLIRRRVLIVDSKRDKAEELLSFKEKLSESGWEYAKKFGDILHVLCSSSDRFRRRRYIREMVRKNPNANLEILVNNNNTDISNNVVGARIYEIHSTCNIYQLRVYILWGRELLNNAKNVNSVFVRVTYIHKSQETIHTQNCLNPIWTETLIFEKILIPGSVNSMMSNPPILLVEIIGRASNEVEIFLGRFNIKPNFILKLHQNITKLNWHALELPGNEFHGSLLLGADLIMLDKKNTTCFIDFPPLKKLYEDRYDIPSYIMPTFTKYNVQMLCWGVRNLAKHKMLSVKKPFVEVSIGDVMDSTNIIEGIKKNPNFTKQLIYFQEIILPEKLYFAPPIMLTLKDKRIFGSKPIVGISLIQNFNKFEIKPGSMREKIEEHLWEKYDKVISLELQEYEKMLSILNIEKVDESNFVNNIRVDWWSKYYFSINENDKCKGYKDTGLESLNVYQQALEDSDDFKGFTDFLQTFKFKKIQKSNTYIQKEQVKGELKGKLIISKCLKGEKNNYVDLDSIPGIEFQKPEKCLIRVYVVRAHQLVSNRGHDTCDSYISIRCGNSKKISLKKEYISDTTDPIFGQVFETEICIPQEKDLQITVMDNRRFSFDEEIGSTTIDLENRLLTKYRATIGLCKNFNIFGPNIWRDQITPLEILKKYLNKMCLEVPELIQDSKKGFGMKLLGQTFYLKEEETKNKLTSQFVGSPYQRLALIVLHRIGLVPEHIETRPLYNSVNKTIECGKLELFVDIFPTSFGTIPPQINISKRIPDKMQLRIAIFGTRHVLLTKKVAGQFSTDMYIKCLLNGTEKAVSTDVHYNVKNGRGSFNWRFVFDINYNVWEEVLVFYKRKRLFRKKSEFTTEPYLILEICDNKRFKKDSVIGKCKIDLLNIEKGTLDLNDFYDENDEYNMEKKKSCFSRICCDCSGGCCCKKKNKKLYGYRRAPRYVEVPHTGPIVSIMEKQSIRGWWPFISENVPDKFRNNSIGHRKKFDTVVDSDDGYSILRDNTKKGEFIKIKDNGTEKPKYVTGFLEMDISIISSEEGKKNPVGKGRKKPNHSPFLPDRIRGKCDSFFLLNRIKVYCSKLCSKKIFWSCCCCLICILLLIGFILALAELPSILAKKIV